MFLVKHALWTNASSKLKLTEQLCVTLNILHVVLQVKDVVEIFLVPITSVFVTVHVQQPKI